MKETIYTIPLNEAFDTDCECPVCEFMKKEEKNLIESTVGASMMEPEFREITNEKGFCKSHHKMILNTENKLSIALITETHMREVEKTLCSIAENVTAYHEKKSLFKKSPLKETVKRELEYLNDITSSCAVCDKLEDTQKRFCDNLIYLYEKEPDFKKKVLNSKGFCLEHYKAVLKAATDNMNEEELRDFLKDITELQNKNFSRVREDVKYFTSLFDYKNRGADPKNSKTALKRSGDKLVTFVD